MSVGIELVAGIRCWIAASFASWAGSSSLCFFNSEILDSSWLDAVFWFSVSSPEFRGLRPLGSDQQHPGDDQDRNDSYQRGDPPHSHAHGVSSWV